MSGNPIRAFDATVTLTYEEAGMLLSALDYALCNQPTPSEHSQRNLRPIVDKFAVTFGFPTARIDRLLKGQRVKKFDQAFD